jgi:hypothetical protein
MNFKFYINGGEVDIPDGWNEMEYKITRDLDNNFTFARPYGKLNFRNGSYEYLNNLRLTGGFCQSVEFLIKIKCAPTDEYQNFFNTRIFIADCEFNTFRCECVVEFKDDGWFATIQKNKKIETYVNTTLTKNLVPITGITPRKMIAFSPYTGINYPIPIYGVFRIYEVLEALVKFMSDDTIVFKSDFFYSGDGADLYIVTGQNLRTRTLDNEPIFAPKLSFEHLYYVLMRKYNLGMSVNSNNGTITLEIEESTYFYGAQTGVTLENIKDEIRYFKTERLFSSLTLGNEDFLEQNQCNNGTGVCTFPQFDLKMFANENFGILGDCNIDRKLELSSAYQITCDSNMIEDCVRYQNTNHDKTAFLIQCEDSGFPFVAAKKTQFASPNTYVYNYDLRNEACAIRWLNNGIAGSIASYYPYYDPALQVWDIEIDIFSPACFQNWAGGLFNIYLKAGVVKYNDAISNPTLLYDSLTGRGTAQMPGLYTIEAQSLIIALSDMTSVGCGSNPSVDFAIKAKMYLRIYDASDNLIYSVESNEFDHQSFLEIDFADNALLTIPSDSYLMDTGYYAQCELYLFQYDLSGTPDPSFGGCNVVITENGAVGGESYFRCTDAEPIQTGEFPNQPNDYKLEAGKFNKFLSFDQFVQLKNNPSYSIDYTTLPNEATRTGFIADSRINLNTMFGEFELFIV